MSTEIQRVGETLLDLRQLMDPLRERGKSCINPYRICYAEGTLPAEAITRQFGRSVLRCFTEIVGTAEKDCDLASHTPIICQSDYGTTTSAVSHWITTLLESLPNRAGLPKLESTRGWPTLDRSPLLGVTEERWINGKFGCFTISEREIQAYSFWSVLTAIAFETDTATVPIFIEALWATDFPKLETLLDSLLSGVPFLLTNPHDTTHGSANIFVPLGRDGLLLGGYVGHGNRDVEWLYTSRKEFLVNFVSSLEFLAERAKHYQESFGYVNEQLPLNRWTMPEWIDQRFETEGFGRRLVDCSWSPRWSVRAGTVEP